MTSRVDEAPVRMRGARPRGGRRRPHGLSRAQRLIFVVALLTLSLTSGYSGLALLGRIYPALFPGQTLGTSLKIAGVVPPLPGLERVTKVNENSVFNERINLLIIGIDRRPQYRADGQPAQLGDPEYRDPTGLTDVIMVATVDPVGRSVNVLSFPRDMMIDINLDKYVVKSRINESYSYGYQNGGRSTDAGAKQLERDMKANFGIDIDNYVMLDFKGVEKLVNVLGGVEVDIPYELSVGNWFYSDDDINGRWISFPPGPQTLDGYMAVAFGRHREYDNDFVRVKRQQLIMQAALRKLFTSGLVNTNPFELWDAYISTVKTDVPKSRMAGLMPLVKQTGGQMRAFSVADPVNGIETLRPCEYCEAALQLWNPDNVQYWLSQVFTKSAYAAANVEIRNGFGDGGQARADSLARYLAYVKGLPTVYTGPDEPEVPRTTITLYGDRRVLAEDIAKWMGIPVVEIRQEPRAEDSALPDVVVVVGKDFRLPAN